MLFPQKMSKKCSDKKIHRREKHCWRLSVWQDCEKKVISRWQHIEQQQWQYRRHTQMTANKRLEGAYQQDGTTVQNEFSEIIWTAFFIVHMGGAPPWTNHTCYDLLSQAHTVIILTFVVEYAAVFCVVDTPPLGDSLKIRPIWGEKGP